MNPNGTHADAMPTTALHSLRDEEAGAARLEARRRAALARLNAARAALRAKPGDSRRAAEVMQSVYALRDLSARCELQRARVGAARAAAGLEPLAGAGRADPFRTARARRRDRFPPAGQLGPAADALSPQGARQR